MASKELKTELEVKLAEERAKENPDTELIELLESIKDGDPEKGADALMEMLSSRVSKLAEIMSEPKERPKDAEFSVRCIPTDTEDGTGFETEIRIHGVTNNEVIKILDKVKEAVLKRY